MRWQSLAKVSAIAGAAGLVLAGCGAKGSSNSGSGSLAKNQVINWSETAEMTSLDPSKVTDVISGTAINNSEEGLYRLGKDSQATPGLATKTKVSKDKKTWTFTLRKNAKWSNGQKVTAKDFVYAWRRTINPKTASQYAYLYSGIKNADAITKGKAKPTSLGVKANGDYQLTVSLEKPIQYFKLLMGFVVFFPQNQTAVEKYGSKYGTTAATTVYDGPFKVTGWQGTNDSWTLVKNKDYWDQQHVKLSKIHDQVVKSTTTGFNLFQSGKLDATQLSGQQVKNEKHNKSLVVRQSARLNYLEFNQKKVKAFKNANIRKAMSLVLNRQQLTSDVLGDGSLAPKGFVTSGLAKDPKTGKDFADQAQVASMTKYDPTTAKQLWKKGLKQLGKKSLTVNFLHDDVDQMKASAEYVQGQLTKELPGLKVNNVTVPYKTRISREIAGNFQLVISAWQADYSDPISDLAILTSSNAYNFGKWQNKQFDADVKKSNETTSETTRWNALLDAEKTLGKDQGVAPLSQNVVAQMYNSKVKGVIYNTAGINWNWKNAYVTK